MHVCVGVVWNGPIAQLVRANGLIIRRSWDHALLAPPVEEIVLFVCKVISFFLQKRFSKEEWEWVMPNVGPILISAQPEIPVECEKYYNFLFVIGSCFASHNRLSVLRWCFLFRLQ